MSTKPVVNQVQVQAPALSPDVASRILKLSTVEFIPKIYKGALIQIDSKGYMGETTTMGSKLVGDVSKAHELTAKPPHMLLLESTTHPGDLVGLPETNRTDDHIDLEWPEKARVMKANLAKVLALRNIKIPAGTKMVIAMYPDKDPVLGDVVGFALKDAIFEPKTTRKSGSKKQSSATTAK